jgi:hypothetical protein
LVAQSKNVHLWTLSQNGQSTPETNFLPKGSLNNLNGSLAVREPGKCQLQIS